MLLDQLTRQFPHRQQPVGQSVEPELTPAASEPALSIKSEPAGVKRDKPGDSGGGAGAGAGPNKKIKVER